MAKYLDPKTDVTFKKVFGEHDDILKSFLNSVLPLPKDAEIKSLDYLTPELLPKTPEGKDSIVDVRCTDDKGRTFIVEMQMYWTGAFKKRALFNTCKAYSYPAERGSRYNELRKVYTLSLVNDIAFPEYPDDYYHIFTMIHHKYKDLKIDDIMMVFIELPKFKSQANTNKELMSLWLRFLTEINDKTKNISPDLQENACISKAVALVEESAYSIPELEAIDKYWDSVSRERTALAERYIEGRIEGRAEGIVEEKVEIARKMKSEMISIDVITRLTGLTVEEIEKL